jgi:paraquat-inducible protein A
MEYQRLIACHECDLLFRKPLLRGGQTASCSRCSATLKGAQGASVPLDRICAVTVAALITFCLAQAFPVIQLQTNGMTSEATAFSAVRSLWTGHMRIVATMVLCAAVLFPLIELLAFLYVLVPLRFGKTVRHFNPMLRVVQLIRPWGMVEVFMLGVVITIVKMVSMAQVIPGPGLFAFGALTLMLAFLATFDPRVLWSTRDEIKFRRPAEIRWIRVKHRCTPRASTFFGRKPAPAAHMTAQAEYKDATDLTAAMQTLLGKRVVSGPWLLRGIRKARFSRPSSRCIGLGIVKHLIYINQFNWVMCQPANRTRGMLERKQALAACMPAPGRLVAPISYDVVGLI